MLENSQIFNLLQPINLDKLLLSVYKKLEKHDGNISLLNTFKDNEKIEYTRSEIITGRLSVSKGPKIMNLPKKYRNILKSRFEEGEILMIDFKSLEPRVARYISKQDASDDIYQDICDQMEFPVDRVVMKRAVISILYGMGEDVSIGELSQDKSRLIRLKVLDYFNINYILELAMQRDASGNYQTYFGRPIKWPADTQLHQVLNGYIQGTAVDVALAGFLDFTRQFNEDMLPIALIHDAMIVDVALKSKEKFVKIINNGYNFKDLGHFPLNIEIISQRKI
jgi:DNA polymerase I-like protein with 3'-5' exonuclease and polymerase domains